MSIGERIVILRKQQNISQSDLARLLDVSRQAVSKWETDRSSPDTLKLIKLSEVLDTNIDYLATGRGSAAAINSNNSDSNADLPSAKEEAQPPSPIVVNLIKRVVETKEKIVEKPIVHYKVRTRYRSNPLTVFLWALGTFLIGLLIGLII